MATIEEKNGHVAANAEARVEDENGGQDHEYCEDATPGHITGEFERKGEDPSRKEVPSTATAGRHIKSKDGLEVAKERSASIQANRKASAACFNSKKLTVCPEQKGRKRK